MLGIVGRTWEAGIEQLAFRQWSMGDNLLEDEDLADTQLKRGNMIRKKRPAESGPSWWRQWQTDFSPSSCRGVREGDAHPNNI